MSSNGSEGSLIAMLAPVLIIGGLLVYLWMMPGVRVKVRAAHGRVHRYFFGPARADTPPEPHAPAPPSGSASAATAASGPLASHGGVDREKECFDYSIFDS